MRFIAVFLSSVLLVGCGTPQFAPHGATVFDELMPRPVKVEAAATDETSVVPVAALGNVTVIRGWVPATDHPREVQGLEYVNVPPV